MKTYVSTSVCKRDIKKRKQQLRAKPKIEQVLLKNFSNKNQYNHSLHGEHFSTEYILDQQARDNEVIKITKVWILLGKYAIEFPCALDIIISNSHLGRLSFAFLLYCDFVLNLRGEYWFRRLSIDKIVEKSTAFLGVLGLNESIYVY